jgi:hypothetical protein
MIVPTVTASWWSVLRLIEIEQARISLFSFIRVPQNAETFEQRVHLLAAR